MTTFGKVLSGGVILLLILVGWLFFGLLAGEPEETPRVVVSDFTECAEAGYPVQESYPRVCRTPEGQSFTEDIGNSLEKADLVRATSPQPGAVVASPLTVRGEARGNWFFEASFPVRLYDSAGNVLATGIAQAEGEWMTTEFVPFTATLTFVAPPNEEGKLVLEKDNPSGLPENADEMHFPVRFR